MTGGPGQPLGGIPGTRAADTGKPGAGGGVQPLPNPSGIPGASEGANKGDLAPGPDQALDDIKKGSR